MDWSTLSRLATGGFAAVPIEDFRDLGAWCQDWCESTGDGRYCLVAAVLTMIDAWWDEHGVPSELVAAVDLVITSRLPGILEVDRSSGALLAAGLRDEVGPLLLPPSAWVEHGYAMGPLHDQ
jgi:hypothetical protein